MKDKRPSLEQLSDYADTLPSMPEVVTQLIRALRDDSSDLETLTRHINADPVIVARLLATANAASSGLARRVRSTGEAFMVLGADRVVEAVLASALIHRYDADTPDFSATLFWRHSLGVAICARAVAEQTGADTELSFICGLLHDIGRLLMLVASPKGMQQVFVLDKPLVAAEREVFGYDHCDAGRILANAWNLPEDIVNALAGHHEPDEVGDELCNLTHIGECMAHALDIGDIKNNRVPELSELACAYVGLSLPMFAPRFGEVKARFENFCLSLGL